MIRIGMGMGAVVVEIGASPTLLGAMGIHRHWATGIKDNRHRRGHTVEGDAEAIGRGIGWRHRIDQFGEERGKSPILKHGLRPCFGNSACQPRRLWLC